MSKVSVIVPVYNVEDYLEKCLDSLVHQTLEEIEILCVDDGSTDHSNELLYIYKNRDPRIQVLEKPNGGLSDARNYGMKFATAPYLFCLWIPMISLNRRHLKKRRRSWMKPMRIS